MDWIFPQLKNIKISAKIQSDFDFSEIRKKSTKSFHNFFVVRENSFVYIIFPDAHHVNITGIKCYEDINSSLQKLFKCGKKPEYI